MQNRFKTFADPEEQAAAAAAKATQAKKAAPKENKKVVVKKMENKPEAAGEDAFETVDRRNTQNAPRRGGNRGNDRPATAGRGRGGDRGGRGRGRGRGGDVTRGGPEGGRRRYEGKPREDAHPMDKKSGTGRGKRDQQKGGHGKGNWGTDKDAEAAGKKDAAEETTDAAPAEKTEEKVEEKKVEEPEEVVTLVDHGMDLEAFLAQKEANDKFASMKAAGRTHEKQTNKNIAVSEDEKKRISTINNKMTGKDTYAVKGGAGAQFFGFSSGGVEEEDAGRGAAAGRGDRERRDRGPRQQRGGAGRGRKGGKIEIDDDEFPAL